MYYGSILVTIYYLFARYAYWLINRMNNSVFVMIVAFHDSDKFEKYVWIK